MGEAAAASAYAGKVATGYVSTELEWLEQTKPSFIQLCTFVMASVCLEDG